MQQQQPGLYRALPGPPSTGSTAPIRAGARNFVDADHEWEPASPAAAGRPTRFRLEIPAGARLGLSYTAHSVAVPVAFSARLDVGGHERPVHAETIAPNDSRAAGWHRATIDLGIDRAAAIRLTLDIDAPGLDPDGPQPVWGIPEILVPTRSAPPDVVLVSIDTLRADRLSHYGYARPTSPLLDRWAERHAVTFERAIAAAPWTLPSHVSLLTGLDAYRHGVNFDTQASGIPDGLETLAERLHAAGYATAAVTAGGFVHPRFGFAQGFDRYRYWPEGADPDQELERGLAYARQVLAEYADRPLFLFFHTYEVHGPNRARQPWFGRFSSHDPHLEVELDLGEPSKTNGFFGEPRPYLVDRAAGRREPLPPELATLPVDLYDSAIAYTDTQLGPFLEELVRRERPTLVIVTSDHGEAMGEAGRYNHVNLSDDTLWVPLLVALPGGHGAGRRIARQVRSVDIVPTVLAALELPAIAGVDGRSLLPLVDDPRADHPPAAWSYAASTNRGLSVRWGNRLKYIFSDSAWPPLQGREHLFDLRTDPGETTDAAPRLLAETNRLRELAVDRLAAATGVRLRLANAGPGALSGRVESVLLDTVTVKSTDPSPPPIAWAGRGRARFELVPGAVSTLVLGRLGEPRVAIRGVVSSPACSAPLPFEASWELATLIDPQQLAVDVARCRIEPPRPGTAATGLSLWWLGPAAPNEAPAPDPALERQLRALGYLGP